jgi:SH3 domain-containing protein
VASFKQMAVRASHATTRSARYALGPSADLPVARIVAILLIVLPLLAIWLAFKAATDGPSPAAGEIASFDPRSVFSDTTPHFLPTPIAALPPDVNSGPPPPAQDEQAATELVKVANTGGVGAILRAEPQTGKQVGALRDGTALQVIDHRTLPDGSEWLHVKTQEGVEGWIFSRLVAPAD